VLFSHSYYNERVRNHTENGGMAVVMDADKVVILDGSNRIEVANLEDIPLSFGKKATVNYDNILAAVAALYAYGVELATIQAGITSYYPTTKDLPGRMNLMKVKDFDLLLDYAHSKVAFDYLKEFLSHFSGDKIGVIDAAGDRSDEEIQILGAIAAQTYDQIIFYEGYDMRGRESGEIINLLKQGALSAEFPAEKIFLFDVPEEAWNAGLVNGEKGKMVVILSPRAEKTLAVIEAFRE
jgi:cyanophycin synthetase